MALVVQAGGVRSVSPRARALHLAGVSAGADHTLHVVQELAGEQARAAAEAEMERMWDRDQALLS